MADEAPTFEEQTANFVVETAEPETPAKEDKPNAEKERGENTDQEVPAPEEGEEAAANADKADATDGVEGDTDDGAEDGRGVDSTAPKRNKISGAERLRQINEATRLMRDTERNVAAREAAVAAREAALSKGGLTQQGRDTTKEDGDTPPDPDDAEKYPYGALDEKYLDDRTNYAVSKALKAKEAKDEKARQADAAAAKQQEIQQRYTVFEEAGTKKYDDFNEVVVEGAKNGNWKPTPVIAELILSSPEGADVAYHLANNPKELREMSGKSPLEQAAYFGRIAAKFSSKPSDAPAKPAAKTTQAPPPVKPARGAGANPGFDPATADFESFEREVNRRK